jgi:uncharacterized cupredoxin-like copper-binding protein
MRRSHAAFAALLSFAALDPPLAASAETVVKITLWDKGAASMDHIGEHKPMGMAVEGADHEQATMGVTLDLQAVPTGEITFKITNVSGEFYHAVVITPVADTSVPLVYNEEDRRVDEGAAGVTANLGELRPHDAKTKKAVLSPGTYILYCNIAGHYAMGMWTLLTVTD